MAIQLISEVIELHRAELGNDYVKYYNHCCRVYTYAAQLSRANKEEQLQLAIATAFHDIGLWTADTFDYLGPSIKLAEEYLKANGLERYSDGVIQIILNHHKLTSFKQNYLAEAFRKADLIDLSYGLFRFGLPGAEMSATNALYPSHGFRRFILKKIVLNFLQHPFNPLPIVKW